MTETAVPPLRTRQPHPQRSRNSSWRRRHCARVFRIRFRHRLSRIRPPTIRDGLALLEARGQGGSWRYPACCLPQVTSKTTCLGNEQLYRRKIRPSMYGWAAISASTELLQRRPSHRRGGGRHADSARRDLLVVVGRGTNDPDAIPTSQSSPACCGRHGLGWPRSRSAASPSAGRRRAVARGEARFRRIIVFPYFLFTGCWSKRIAPKTDTVAALFPEIEFVKALYLRDHEGVSALSEIVSPNSGDSQPAMNCQLCQVSDADHR